jgi:hypothetical protein
MSDQSVFPSAPQDEPAGDSGDQAQRLQMAEEQEAIAAALAGFRGDDSDTDRPARVELLEGEDPVSGPTEGDSSDDPTYGGGDVTGLDPADEARALADDED